MKKAKIMAFLILIFLLVSTLTYTVYAVITASLTFSNTISFNTTTVHFKAVVQVYYEGFESEILSTKILNKAGTQTDDVIWDIAIPGPFSITKTKNAIIYDITIHNYSDYAIEVALNVPAIEEEFEDKLTRESSSPVTVVAKNGTTIQSAFVTLKTTFLKSTTSFQFDNSFAISINQAD